MKHISIIKTKRLSLAILTSCLFFYNTGKSQSTHTDLKKDAISWLTATCDGKFEDVVDYINPKIFKVNSKAKMKKTFESRNQKDMKIKCIAYKITNISEVIAHGEASYVLINFDLDQEINFYKALSPKEGNEIKSAFDGLYGKENWSRNGNTISTHIKKYLIADLPKSANHWTFMEYDKTWLRQVEKDVIPIEVRNKMGLQ